MKIRRDFVTNSSSSSFIIAFSKIPECIEDVKNELFGDKKLYFSDYGDLNWSTEQVAETVYNDIKDQIPNIYKEILDSLKNGWFDGRKDIDYDNFLDKDRKIDWDKYHEASNNLEEINGKIADNIVNEFITKNGDKYIYTVSYADEDGQYFSALEHGDLFDKIPHIRTSYH